MVELLVASAPSGTEYAATATETFTLAVEPLQPAAAVGRSAPATPTGESRPFIKALVQSGRSDFQREGWEAPGTLSAMRKTVMAADESALPVRAAVTARSPPPPSSDRGLDTTRYLLRKFIDNGGAREPCESTRTTLSRRGTGGPQGVDLYEMYWADLSRLSGAIPRIVTELFTMVFRLSKLGRETVDEARRHVRGSDGRTPASWHWFANTQIALDWAFVNGLALLFAQLGLLALVFVVFGLAAPYQEGLRLAVGCGVLVVSLLWLGYRWRDPAAPRWPLAALALAAAAMLAYPPSAFWILGLFGLALLTVAYDAALRVADDRFPLTRVPGLALWGIALVLTLGAAVWRIAVQGEAALPGVWAQSALLGVEVALDAIKWWWMLAGPVFVLWLLSGAAAARHGGYLGAASVATGRLAFFVSLGTFVMLTMATWALVSGLLGLSVARLDYTPRLFAPSEVASGVSDAARAAGSCPWHEPAGSPPGRIPKREARSDSNASPAANAAAPAAPSPAAQASAPPSSAEIFLRTRYEDSTSFFALVAALLLMLVAYLAAMFLPSVLAELKLLRQRARRDPARSDATAADDGAARRLGRWLTAGYRRLDRAVLVVVAIGIVLSATVGYVLKFGSSGFGSNALFGDAMNCVAYLSQSALKPLVLGAAGIAAALTALGGVLSRYLPGLRAPLDIALDIDNYLREFPRRSIPRARIFSRYAALLQHVARQGYDRIVIVSHSQGTVISADLLRFLSTAGDGADDNPVAPQARALRLRELLGADVRLLTLGCPLRQLYAARFPSLYGWVLASHPAGNGPEAADIGVERWANAYTSGDYVGRWLWSSPAELVGPLGHPATDTLQTPLYGRTDAYAPFVPMPPTASSFPHAREFEVCLGLGAHTHYFEPDQAAVAWLIDHLVASPTVTDPDDAVRRDAIDAATPPA